MSNIHKIKCFNNIYRKHNNSRRYFSELFLFCFASLLFFFVFYSDSYSAKKQLRWAADAEGNAPYIFQDPDERTVNIGFEVDIINEIAENLGWTPIFFQNQWDGLVPGLQRNDYDVAINGIEITEDRKDEINFSIPYFITYEQLIVLREENRYASLSDLTGKNVGALKESLAEKNLERISGD